MLCKAVVLSAESGQGLFDVFVVGRAHALHREQSVKTYENKSTNIYQLNRLRVSEANEVPVRLQSYMGRPVDIQSALNPFKKHNFRLKWKF